MFTRCLLVTETSQIATARRGAAAAAQAAAFDAVDIGRVALAATELATNVLRHGSGGMLLVRTVEAASGDAGIELLALDKGPGMRNVQECLRDGFSTAGTPGSGLGAVRRQADVFDVYSVPGTGTAVLALLWPRRAAPSADQAVQIGSVAVAKPGEEICGDGWSVRLQGHRLVAMVADGLGHGLFAAQAAGEAVRLFNRQQRGSARDAVEAIHAGLRATRGAAVAVADVDMVEHRLLFSGIGNIAGTLVTNGQTRRLVSLNGIAGHAAPRIQAFSYPYSGHAFLLIMHSDGLAMSWALDRYPGLAARHPGIIAGVLFRDFSRTRDDATVLVVRSTR
ncbi:ATP-binding protein [Vineibacter terrae]|uniref:ATP-binding protein n=1 Tax=Vineibacter terrae TaxID=2586908 RepID=UPI002E2FB400|nr:ATP-binding protein [Vineibacter terrae]HEX2890429.1 ATP-binding protein [Vineibacter terrae]